MRQSSWMIGLMVSMCAGCATTVNLSALPDPEGFAAMYAGVSGDALVAAGGANFPDKPPWDGGKKHWTDAIYVLPEPESAWIIAGTRLPRPLAYGSSVTHRGRVICIGGGDATQHYADVFALTWNGEDVTVTPLPSLPQPLAFSCAAVVGDTVYVAGGASEPAATRTLHVFYALDLSRDDATWQTLEPWPGPARQQAVAAARGGDFYLISGLELTANEQGNPWPVAPYFADAYRYSPRDGAWRRLADLPRGVAAAATPAKTTGDGFVVFGGLDGSTLDADPRDYPPLPRDVVAYDAARDAWTVRPPMSQAGARVTPPAVTWRGRYVVVSGEVRPGRRTPTMIVMD